MYAGAHTNICKIYTHIDSGKDKYIKYIPIHTYIYVNVYIYREREIHRESERLIARDCERDSLKDIVVRLQGWW